MRRPWKLLNLGSKHIFLNIRMIAANTLNTCTLYSALFFGLGRATALYKSSYYYDDMYEKVKQMSRESGERRLKTNSITKQMMLKIDEGMWRNSTEAKKENCTVMKEDETQAREEKI